MVTPGQIRAARALLGWTQAKLAAEARLSVLTVLNFENGAGSPKVETYDRIVEALTAAGIVFLSSGGVDLRPPAEYFLKTANPADPQTRATALAILNAARKARGQAPLKDDDD